MIALILYLMTMGELPVYNPGADFNRDGRVNAFDLAGFCYSYGRIGAPELPEPCEEYLVHADGTTERIR